MFTHRQTNTEPRLPDLKSFPRLKARRITFHASRFTHHASAFTLIEVLGLSTVLAAGLPSIGAPAGTGMPAASTHPNLPRIRFLPDGSISESSPQTLHLKGRDGSFISLSLSKRLNYEIEDRIKQ